MVPIEGESLFREILMNVAAQAALIIARWFLCSVDSSIDTTRRFPISAVRGIAIEFQDVRPNSCAAEVITKVGVTAVTARVQQLSSFYESGGMGNVIPIVAKPGSIGTPPQSQQYDPGSTSGHQVPSRVSPHPSLDCGSLLTDM